MDVANWDAGFKILYVIAVVGVGIYIMLETIGGWVEIFDGKKPKTFREKTRRIVAVVVGISALIFGTGVAIERLSAPPKGGYPEYEQDFDPPA